MALKSLIIKEAELTESLIEKVIVPFCQYTETGRIILNEKFYKLSTKQQILIYLIAKSGLPYVVEAPADKEIDISASNSELEKALNVKGNTIRPRLSELRSKGLVLTEKDRHKISNHAPSFLIEELNLK